MDSWKVFSSRFELKGDRVSTQGLLIKLLNSKNQARYTCLQSWESLGDIPQAQLEESFHKGNFSDPQIRRAIELALEAGSPEQWNYEKHFLKSHLLWDDCFELSEDWIATMIEYGFRSSKIKIDKDLGLNLLHLQKHFLPLDVDWSLRLDFNLKFSKKEVFSAFANLDSEFLKKIDWVEDPFSGSENEWDEFFDKFSVKLAPDWISWKHNISNFENKVLVKKPLREKTQWRSKTNYLLTSYLSHPIEQLISQASVFLKISSEEEEFFFGGFASHFYFKQSIYSDCLGITEASVYCANKEKLLDLLDQEDWMENQTLVFTDLNGELSFE